MSVFNKKPSPIKFAVAFTSSFLIGYLSFVIIFAGPEFLGAFFYQSLEGNMAEVQIPEEQTGEPQFFPQLASDFGPIGAMNHQYLQGHTFKKIVIEVDYQEGSSPDERAMSALASKIERYADKPQGVEVQLDDVIESEDLAYTLVELRNLMRQYRDNYSRGDIAVIYIMYMEGEFSDMENTLGLIVNASSFIVFPDEIEKSPGTEFFGRSVFEEAVLVHEYGHMLGLVNINYRSEIAHEDPLHISHSNNRDSVMYWAVEDLSLGNFFRGGPPTEFDEADEFDIEQIKAGIY